MKKGEFISVSKRMVKEHYNRYVADEKGVEKLKTGDVHVVRFKDDDGMYEIVLTTSYYDGMYYEVTYDVEKDELESRILKYI